jgi:hypothetical protein
VINAQNTPIRCGTIEPELSPEAFRKFCEYRDKPISQERSAITNIPVQFTQVKGVKCENFQRKQDLESFLSDLNTSGYFPLFNFYLAGSKYIEVSTPFILEPANHAQHVYLYGLGGVSNAMNIFIGDGGVAAFATFPDLATASIPYGNFVAIPSGAMSNITILAHELGHYFGLYHTHYYTGINSAKSEPVSRDLSLTINCQNGGDFITDTPADPGVFASGGFDGGLCHNSDCSPGCEGNPTDAAGDMYEPDKTNLMSYWDLRGCATDHFSKEQQNLMVNMLQSPSRSFLNNATQNSFDNAFRGDFWEYNAAASLNPIRTLNRASSDNIGGIDFTFKLNNTIISTTNLECNATFPYAPINTLGIYSVIPSKNNMFRNSVTVDDANAVKNHCLTTVLITDAFKLIAADVNYTGTLTTSDAYEIQRNSLGLTTQFPNSVPSYRFIPSAYINQSGGILDFVNSNPFNKTLWASSMGGIPGTGSRNYKPLNGNISYFDGLEVFSNSPVTRVPGGLDFFAIKMGDVNLSSFNRAFFNKNNGELTTNLATQFKGKELTIALKAQEDITTAAFQLGLDYDSEKIEILEVMPNNKQFYNFNTNDNFNITEKGKILSSWFYEKRGNEYVNADDAIFTIRLRCKADISNWEEVFQLDREKLGIRFLNEMGESSFTKVILEENKQIDRITSNIVVFPNPTSKDISFKLSATEETNATLEVFNTLGQIVYNKDYSLTKGINFLTIADISDVQSGVLSFKISTKEQTYIGKFIKR